MKIDEKKVLEEFIFNDEIQALLSNIKSSVMDFNIFEIAGLSTQEVKYSHILAWLFGDNEHNLEYKILEGFLKKVIELEQNSSKSEEIEALKHYIYLPNKDKKITIHREKNNIDLLLVDENNQIVITIENKVLATERKKGKDGGQLQKYYSYIENEYKSYDKFYIYLTKGNYLPESEENQERWLVASHSFVGKVIENIVEKDLVSHKTELILNSYVDLLKRQNMEEDEKLKELCRKIWAKEETALNILNEYKYSKIDRLFDAILEDGNFNGNVPYSGKKYEGMFLKTRIGDKLTEELSNGEYIRWEDYPDNSIDLFLEKDENYLWFGYCHIANKKNKKNIHDEIVNKLELNNKNRIILKKDKKYILDNDFDKIKNEFIKKIKEEIKKLEEVVSEVLDIKV